MIVWIAGCLVVVTFAMAVLMLVLGEWVLAVTWLINWATWYYIFRTWRRYYATLPRQ